MWHQFNDQWNYCIEDKFLFPSIFIQYLDFNSLAVKEESLVLAKVIRSKSAETLFNLIFEVLQDRRRDINQMRTNRFDVTNRMNGETSGFEHQFRHSVPLPKYIVGITDLH